MSDVATWTVSQYLLVGLLMGVFGLIGFRRGVNRELISLLGLGVAVLVATQVAPSLDDQVNRFYRMVRFALGGGLGSDDPAAAWEAAKVLPALIETEAQQRLLSVVVFAIMALLVYMVGDRRVAPTEAFLARLLGLFVGLINGFLVAYYLAPIVFTASQVNITLQSGDVQATLTDGQTLARLGLFLICVLIAVGLYNASTRRGKP
jgi:uncharacterized membrane protein required for colicin V production